MGPIWEHDAHELARTALDPIFGLRAAFDS
jgi:hypothetical protein